ncbi:hypothetical protein [Magnetospirillum moscoviense]|uniref:BioF2-like acetyltransferase domain-containing protein n=1 Tax=Magnetospirillum moscoviense TaxID=1437059 RepID=A0A178M6H8_9PROT|nr:hypothetical protein [Magnetospirillum moscoviense]OAN44352.1 hypothetical protein A6A05_17570 [Magnetospirillum moscoviense]
MDAEELYQASRFAEFEQALKILLADPALELTVRTQVAARLGHFYRRCGRWDMAEALYRALEPTIDDRAVCRRILAGILRRGGRPGESAALLEQLLSDSTGTADATFIAYQAALARLADGDPAAAHALLVGLRRLKPDHAPAHWLAGLLECQGRRPGCRIIQALAAPAEFAAQAGSVAWQNSTDWAARWFRWASHPAYMAPETVENCSFVVTHPDGRPVLLVRLWASENGIESGDTAIHLLQAPGVGCSDKVLAAAVGHILDLCKAFGGRPLIADRMAPELGQLGRACLKQGLNAELQIGLTIDLARPVEELWQGLRPSNHALIHRGETSLEMRYLNGDQPDWRLFEDLRQCHYRFVPVPGSEALFFTLPVLRGKIEAGHAELSVALRDGQAVAVVLIVDEGADSHYAVARYPRDLADNSSRFTLWDAILRAKARGQARFHLGEYAFDAAHQGKLRTVADFKAGFTRARICKMAWRVGV